MDRLVVEFLPNGRDIKLVEEFKFVDPKGNTWIVPAGAVVDGASIPRPLWSIVGSPLTGKYRSASVIHDYYCEKRLQNWTVVHRVFHEAMLAGGVDKVQAAYMYWAVYRFGPRWDIVLPGNCWPDTCFEHQGYARVLKTFVPDAPKAGYLESKKRMIEGNARKLDAVVEKLKKEADAELTAEIAAKIRSKALRTEDELPFGGGGAHRD